MPLKFLGNLTPYEKLYNTKHDNSFLKAYGSLCFVSTKQGRKKFQARANPCIFVGYPFAKKAYKVHNLQTKTFHVFKDIIFHENIFPYHLTPNYPTLPLPFYLPTPTIFSHNTTPSYPPPTTSPKPIDVYPSSSSTPTKIHNPNPQTTLLFTTIYL